VKTKQFGKLKILKVQDRLGKSEFSLIRNYLFLIFVIVQKRVSQN
jgi:hypothetical protein